MSARLRAGVAISLLCLVWGCAAASAFAALTQAGRPAETRHATKRRACAHRARHGTRHHRCHARRRHAGTHPPSSLAAPTALVTPVAGGLVGATAPATGSAAATPDAAPVTSTGSTEAGAPPETPTEPPVEPPSVPHVQVSAVEYSFALSRPTVPAGKVVLQFVNDGQDEHNLKVASLQEGPLVASFANTPAKGIGEVELEMQPGEYTLFCSLPTHESRGMKATLVVE